MRSVQSQFNERWGWFKLAKDVADYTNISFFDVMDRCVLEVLTITMMILDEVDSKSVQSKNQIK